MVKSSIPQNHPYGNVAEVELIYKTTVKPADRPKVLSSKHAVEVLAKVYDSYKIEHKEFFFVMLLNRANQLLGVMQVSQGGITGTVVDVRHIYQAAIKANATSMIVSHNHPSGNLYPSEADMLLTRRIKDGAEILDIPLKDHIIVTPDFNYYSFADEGKL
jgi:DNA repair protein RadC